MGPFFSSLVARLWKVSAFIVCAMAAVSGAATSASPINSLNVMQSPGCGSPARLERLAGERKLNEDGMPRSDGRIDLARAACDASCIGGLAMSRLRLRPRDGWRPFLGEVGVIILGVLIALGLGAVATEIGWQVETRSARKAIGLELGEAVGQGLERVRIYDCVEKRLDQVSEIIEQGSATGRLPPVGDIGLPAFHTWNHGSWDSIVSAQTASHFNREELAAYVAAYEYITGLGESAAQEFDAWTRLYSLVGPGRPLSTAEAADLRRQISETRVLNRRMARRGLLLTQLVAAYELFADEAYMREYVDKPLPSYAICRPVESAIPPRYGQAPRGYDLKGVQDNPLTRIPLR